MCEKYSIRSFIGGISVLFFQLYSKSSVQQLKQGFFSINHSYKRKSGHYLSQSQICKRFNIQPAKFNVGKNNEEMLPDHVETFKLATFLKIVTFGKRNWKRGNHSKRYGLVKVFCKKFKKRLKKVRKEKSEESLLNEPKSCFYCTASSKFSV